MTAAAGALSTAPSAAAAYYTHLATADTNHVAQHQLFYSGIDYLITQLATTVSNSMQLAAMRHGRMSHTLAATVDIGRQLIAQFHACHSVWRSVSHRAVGKEQ